MYILWVLANVYWHVSIIIGSCRVFSLPRPNSLCSAYYSLSYPNPGNEGSFSFLRGFAFFVMSYSWNHSMKLFQTGFFHLIIMRLFKFLPCLVILIAHFFLALIDILLPQCSTVYLFIHLLNYIFRGFHYIVCFNICVSMICFYYMSSMSFLCVSLSDHPRLFVCFHVYNRTDSLLKSVLPLTLILSPSDGL